MTGVIITHKSYKPIFHTPGQRSYITKSKGVEITGGGYTPPVVGPSYVDVLGQGVSIAPSVAVKMSGQVIPVSSSKPEPSPQAQADVQAAARGSAISGQLLEQERFRQDIGGYQGSISPQRGQTQMEGWADRQREMQARQMWKAASPAEKVGLRSRTLLSGSGYEQILATVSRKDESVVREKIKEDISYAKAGESPTGSFVRGIQEGFSSPVLEAEMFMLPIPFMKGPKPKTSTIIFGKEMRGGLVVIPEKKMSVPLRGGITGRAITRVDGKDFYSKIKSGVIDVSEGFFEKQRGGITTKIKGQVTDTFSHAETFPVVKGGFGKPRFSYEAGEGFVKHESPTSTGQPFKFSGVGYDLRGKPSKLFVGSGIDTEKIVRAYGRVETPKSRGSFTSFILKEEAKEPSTFFRTGGHGLASKAKPFKAASTELSGVQKQIQKNVEKMIAPRKSFFDGVAPVIARASRRRFSQTGKTGLATATRRATAIAQSRRASMFNMSEQGIFSRQRRGVFSGTRTSLANLTGVRQGRGMSSASATSLKSASTRSPVFGTPTMQFAPSDMPFATAPIWPEEYPFRAGKTKGRKAFQPKGYSPSLIAVEFGIKGKASPVVTGFGVRPIINTKGGI